MRWLALWLVMAVPGAAQDLGGMARVDAAGSVIVDAGQGFDLTLYLSQAVPFRVFSLDDPARFVIDFREADWRGVTPEGLDQADGVVRVLFGPVQPGWSRLVIELAQPMTLVEAGLHVNAADGTAVLRVLTAGASADAFAAEAGAPEAAGWQYQPGNAVPEAEAGANAPLVVAIDAHGTILGERIARVLAEAINRTEILQAVLTFEGSADVEDRIAVARAAGAGALLSVRIEPSEFAGVVIYTFSPGGIDSATQQGAPDGAIAGVNLGDVDADLGAALTDLARQETAPAAERLADMLVVGLSDQGVALAPQPRGTGAIAAIELPDLPSVLMALPHTFDVDEKALSELVQGLVQGLVRWQAAEAIRAPLLRQ